MKEALPVINYHFEASCQLRNRNKLRAFIIDVFKKYRTRAASLNIVFCSDEYLLEINRDYLQHDYYTDIITFNLAATHDLVLGEIYISVDRVRENAKSHSASFNHELHRVIFHGVLHLSGLNDKTASDKKKMTQAENKLLKQYFHLPSHAF